MHVHRCQIADAARQVIALDTTRPRPDAHRRWAAPQPYEHSSGFVCSVDLTGLLARPTRADEDEEEDDGDYDDDISGLRLRSALCR